MIPAAAAKGKSSGDEDDGRGCHGGENGRGGDCMGEDVKLTTALNNFSHSLCRS
jgi:hypothetical protein